VLARVGEVPAVPADRVVGRHPEEDGLALGAAREEELDVRRSGFGLHGTEREVRGDGGGLGQHGDRTPFRSQPCQPQPRGAAWWIEGESVRPSARRGSPAVTVQKGRGCIGEESSGSAVSTPQPGQRKT